MLGIGAGFDHLLTNVAREEDSGSPPEGSAGDGTVPFYGTHQAGIGTPAPEFLNFAAFDVTSDAGDDLRGVLQE
jgi:deferrochelatase/peroxidase EfeB